MYHFSIYALDGDHKISVIEENPNTSAFFFKLLTIFSKIDYVNKKITFVCLQQMNNITRTNIHNLIKEFEILNIKLRKFMSYFNNIKDGEYFYVFPEVELTIDQALITLECVRLLNNGIKESELEEKLKEPMELHNRLFSNILKNYKIKVIDPHKKNVYGCKKRIEENVNIANAPRTTAQHLMKLLTQYPNLWEIKLLFRQRNVMNAMINFQKLSTLIFLNI